MPFFDLDLNNIFLTLIYALYTQEESEKSIHSNRSFKDFIDRKFGNRFEIINSKLEEIWKLNSKIGERKRRNNKK